MEEQQKMLTLMLILMLLIEYAFLEHLFKHESFTQELIH